MISKQAILAGAFGGIAPNLLRVAISLTATQHKSVTDDPALYILGMIVLAVLGGAVALAWKETDLRKAVLLGVGLPSLLQIAGLESSRPASGPSGKPPTQTAISFSVPLVSSAYAQTSAPVTTSPSFTGRTIDLVGDKNTPNYEVSFFQHDGQQLSTRNVTKPSMQTIEVPETATSFAIQRGNSTSPAYDLPKVPNSVKQVDVEIAPKKANGFLQALGFDGSSEYVINASVKNAKPLTAGTAGWSFLGQYSQTGWTTQYVKFEGGDHIPTSGEVGTVNLPLRVRDGASPQAKEVGVALAGQKLRISDVKDTGQGLYWASVTVVQ
jgi:hypothetical protein